MEVSAKDERNDLMGLCETDVVDCKRDMVSEGKRNADFEKNRESNDKNVWC